ncbi:hypothetical protein [Acidovorax sp.]|uniref:hypothetical protein n=1 Tax=Acidovorax sp. TaxID=1872122 RepID=UPI00391F56F1
MKTELRHLAVHVVEPRVGDFRWVLIELTQDHTWSEIEIGKVRVATYKQAMADGLVALEAMVRDLDHGPRSDAAQEGLSRLARREKSEVRGNNPAARDDGLGHVTRRSAFGFGLAN